MSLDELAYYLALERENLQLLAAGPTGDQERHALVEEELLVLRARLDEGHARRAGSGLTAATP